MSKHVKILPGTNYLMKFPAGKALAFLLFLFMVPLSVWAQQTPVKGSVLDQEGLPLIGVSITVKGTSTGVSTDVNGGFSINAASNAVLLFNYLGMQTKEVPVAGQSSLTVTMQEASQDLDEVLVVGYGTQKKKDLTTSISSVNSKEWENRPITSAQQALQGKAAGVQVIQPSGKPGVGMSVRVRGATSINAGNEPLYVIDGIPTDNISNLSAEDIESMQILKDASSAAIYGARAANGVVLISTKRGTSGKAQVELSMYGGFSKVGKTIDALNTNQYYDLMEELNVAVDRIDQNYTNWNDETYGTGAQQNYQLAVSGGNEQTNYYVSAGYQNEKGVIAPAEYERFSLRSNINSEVKKWLKMTSSISFSQTDRMDATDNIGSDRGGIVLSTINTPPFLNVWDPEHPGQYQMNPFQPSWENPLAQANTYARDLNHRFMGNFGLDFIIAEGLHFKPSASVDYLTHRYDQFIHPERTAQGRSANGIGNYDSDQYMTWLNENIVTYDKTFDEKHNLSLLGGVIFQGSNEDRAHMHGEDYVKGTNWDVMTLSSANKVTGGTNTKSAYNLMSGIMRAHYNYESRYLVTANIRADGSSKLDSEHQWGYFPSLSMGWRFSDEDFFSSMTDVVNDAKLRFGAGQNGNQNGLTNFGYQPIYGLSPTPDAGSGPDIFPETMGNKDLTWEITTQYDLGLDLSMFNSRITLAVDAYYKITNDLLLRTELPSTVGYTEDPVRNAGQMKNKGIEFEITTQNMTGAFKWDTQFNMSFNRNELTQMYLTQQYYTGYIEGRANAIIIQEGLPLGSFYGYVSEGVNPETGDMIYSDLNGNGYVDPEDRTVIGSAQPDFIFGMTNNFSYKNFSMSMFFQGSVGNDIFNASRIQTEGMYDSKNQSTAVLDRWMRPGMQTDIPRAGNSNNSLISSRFVEDGSYLRLKSLTVAYNLKTEWLKKMGMENLNIYATGNNLFTLTRYSGYDPEVNMTENNVYNTENAANGGTIVGMDYGTYPQTMSLVFGLNVTF